MMELWKRKDQLDDAIIKFLLRYEWEWFCSLPLKWGTDCPMAESLLKTWRTNMCIHQDHILITYMGVFNMINNPHIHLLVWGKGNQKGQTLLDLNPKDWEKEWLRLTKHEAVIEPIYDREGIAEYITKKNLPWGKSELIRPYPKKRFLNHR